jgi:ADP-heptose:LPS heptosyltransferase
MGLIARLSPPDLQGIAEYGPIWINPVGGLGDALMLSGVLKQVIEKYPEVRFNLVRRTQYTALLHGHPAIASIGFPPPGSKIIGSDYWSMEEYRAGNRAYQTLAGKFGLVPPVKESMYLPSDGASEDFLIRRIPWKEKNVVIAPASDSPRKMAPITTWKKIVSLLNEHGVFVAQMGREREERIKGAYSLLGLTTPLQAIAVLKKTDAAVTVDNFIMHAAHAAGTPAVVLWGPTNAAIYGYAEQIPVKAFKDHCIDKIRCLGPEFADNYAIACPRRKDHCMATIPADEVIAFLVKNNYIL